MSAPTPRDPAVPRRSMRAVHICSFSGPLADLPAKLRGNDAAVLAVLAEHPRFSCWDASEHITLANTLDRLGKKGRIKYVHETKDFPWCRVEVLPEPTPCAACAGRGSVPLGGRHHRVCTPCQGNGWIPAATSTETPNADR